MQTSRKSRRRKRRGQRRKRNTRENKVNMNSHLRKKAKQEENENVKMIKRE